MNSFAKATVHFALKAIYLKTRAVGLRLPTSGLTIRPILAQTDLMAGEQISSLIMQIIDELRARGVLITNRGGDWCVRSGPLVPLRRRNISPTTCRMPLSTGALSPLRGLQRRRRRSRPRSAANCAGG